MQRLAKLIYPAQCITCDEMIEAERGLCPKCWSQTPFIIDPPCDACGRPLIGEVQQGDLCDDCQSNSRPWDRGRAVMLYADNGRSLVLKFKHGDRTDLARPAGAWLADAAAPLIAPDTVVVPVPLHWLRIFRRRYNQSALLAAQLAKIHGLDYVPDLLRRPQATRKLDGMTAIQREETVSGAIAFSQKHHKKIADRHVLLVDDVMTTGATLAQCARICLAAGAKRVSITVLARVARED